VVVVLTGQPVLQRRNLEARSAMFCRAWLSTRLSAPGMAWQSATQAVVSWSSWNLGWGWRLAA